MKKVLPQLSSAWHGFFQQAYLQWVGRLFVQFGGRTMEDRVSFFRCDLEQRRQYEITQMQEGVGDDQIRRIDDFVSVEKQIDIDQPRGPFVGSLTTHPLFNQEDLLERLPGRQGRFYDQGLVEEIGLFGNAPSLGLVHTRGL